MSNPSGETIPVQTWKLIEGASPPLSDASPAELTKTLQYKQENEYSQEA
jgi:hypothetical protein